MSKLETPDAKRKNSWRSVLPAMLAGAVLGYVGYRFGAGAAGGGLGFTFGLSELAALVVSFVLLVCAVIVGVGTAIPSAGLSMNIFDDIEQWEDERHVMWLSVFGCLAYGLAMALLALAEPLALTGSYAALAGLVVLVCVFAYTAWRLVVHYDELWTGVNSETCVIALYLVFAIGGGWSILAHMGFAAALAALDWLTLLGATSLVGAIVATHRRGVLRT